MENHEIEKKIVSLKGILQKEYHVSRIGLFGSFARNEQSPESDIDILVEFSRPLGWNFFELQEFLESQLGKKVDLVSSKALKGPLKDAILNQVQYF